MIISRLFDPIVVLGATAMAAARQSLPAEGFVPFVLTFFFAIIVPPAVALLWAVRTGRVSDWDVSNRRQRVRVLAIFAGFLLFDLLLVYIVANALFSLFLVFLFWFAGFLVLPCFGKFPGTPVS